MENQNTNAVSQQGSDEQAFNELLNLYSDRDNKKKRLSKDELLARYFNPRKDTEIFRALPKLEGEKLIEEGYFHKVQAGKYIKNTATAYCPAKNNPKVQALDKKTGQPVVDQQGNPVMINDYCPLCAKANRIKSKMIKNVPKKENLKTDEEKLNFEKNRVILSEANKYESKLYYIIRGIDRGAEKDGVKFWRFKQNYKSQGVHDKLWIPIIQGYYKQTGKMYNSIENGIDLLISVVDNSFNGNTYRDVSAINARMGGASPLHTDPIIAKQWLDDKTTWRDVFKPKKAPGITEVQYLELASEEREAGQKYDMRNTPYYDEELKKWVFPNHPDLEAAANTRNQNLDANSDEEIVEDESGYISAAHSVVQNNNLDITQMSTEAPKGEAFNHGSESIGVSPKNEPANASAYDDLPF